MSNYEAWQEENYGNVLPEPIVLPSGEVEGKNEEIDRMGEWMQLQAELILWDHQRDY